ncbi:HlyD family efflux transporter periplasmic adaptor subunit [Streptomyces sp. NPDC006662]|uniref:HlyD family efflux transporter periplasmic adaptor subunit n=1 Tax=Streptomyces sp. NPDC006662 TaxID=3156902 RepID=UPI0033C3D03E
MQFRSKALSKLQSPDELDLPVRFARPQGRLVLAVTVIVMVIGCVWAFTGSVSVKLSASGVLTRAEGSYVLQSPYAGQITGVLARQGQLLPAGAPVVRIATDRGEQVVRTVAGGRVTTLVAGTGSVVTTGADVATVERAKNADDPLVAVLYVPGTAGATVPVGARVDLTVPSAPRERYGVLRGRVTAVGRAPQTQTQIGGFLADARFAAQFVRQGNPVPLYVELERAATTRSGYRWSSADGPPFTLGSPAEVTAAVQLPAQRPADWLLP